MSNENILREILHCKLQIASTVIDNLPSPLNEQAKRTFIQTVQILHDESALFLAGQQQDRDKKVIKPVVIE